MSHSSATASAAANIALIKYWGKSSIKDNQPATGSVSIGIEDLRTTTTLEFAVGDEDTFDTVLDYKARSRTRIFLERLRNQYGTTQRLHVKTANNFPTGTGLASSASGFAALSLAFDSLFDLKLTGIELSRMARLGSGSAARSVYGGIVEMIPSKDSYAIPIASAEHWPLDVLVAVTEENQKSIGSTDAMTQTAISSPFYESWLDSQTKDIESAKHAIQKRDFEKLADASEHNCLKMHATMITTLPAIIYWQPATLAIIHEVRRLRSTGVPVFFTIDAGAQVKLVCSPEATFNVIKQLDAISGITQLIVTKVGGYPIVSTL